MKKLFIILLSCLFISGVFCEETSIRLYSDCHKHYAPVNFNGWSNTIELKCFFCSKVIPRENGYYEIEFTSIVTDLTEQGLTSFTTTYYVKKGDVVHLYYHEENEKPDNWDFLYFKEFKNNFLYFD